MHEQLITSIMMGFILFIPGDSYLFHRII
jgi:hypothetical protein